MDFRRGGGVTKVEHSKVVIRPLSTYLIPSSLVSLSHWRSTALIFFLLIPSLEIRLARFFLLAQIGDNKREIVTGKLFFFDCSFG